MPSRGKGPIAKIDKPRDDGQYIYRAKLATYMGERQREIEAREPGERSDDEHLILYMAGETARLGSDFDRVIRRRDVREEQDEREINLLAEAYEDLVGRHDGVMAALRVFGYRGKDYGVFVTGWLNRLLS